MGRFLSRIPIERDSGTGEERTMNLYKRVLDTLVEKATGPNGEVPVWLQVAQLLFSFGSSLAEKANTEDSTINKGMKHVFEGMNLSDVQAGMVQVPNSFLI